MMITEDFWSKKERVLTIKLRLYTAAKDRTVASLQNLILEKTGIECNYSTLKDTYDPYSNNYNLNTMCIIGLCKALDLSISAVLSDPKMCLGKDFIKDYSPQNDIDTKIYPSEASNNGSSGKQSMNNFIKLKDEHYFNRDTSGNIIPYYGYMYSSKPALKQINKFELILNEDGAKLRIIIPYIKSDGSSDVNINELTGTPILAKRQNSIHIVFKNDIGGYYIFNFSYAEYATQNLYYRRGSVMTQGRDSSRSPMMESFVMFKDPVTEENESFIPGLLLLSNKSFHITESVLKELEKSEPIKSFMAEFDHIIDHTAEKTYLINENQILEDSDIDSDKLERTLQALQILKGASNDLTRIYYPENSLYSEFSKTLHGNPRLETCQQ